MDIFLGEIGETKKLNVEDKSSREGRITFQEYELCDNKSSGSDSLTAKFYKTSATTFGQFLMQVYTESFHYGEVCRSQKESVLTLIFKKGDRQLMKKCRSISITNIDYKIIAKILDNRLHTVLPELISHDQTAYNIKGRTISQNNKLVQDIILFADKHKLDIILLFLDFENAFDSVEHKYIYKTMEKFNFGENLIKWIKTLYSGCSAKIKNNGYLSESFNISRGIKQGCPVSELLFNSGVETMALSIKKNDKIHGIKITVSIPEAFSQISKFTEVFGLKLIIEKTEGMNIGTQKPINHNIFIIRFCKSNSEISRYLRRAK